MIPLGTPRVARAQGAQQRGLALWNLGFRPFYLAASLFAALSVPLWAAQYAGHLHFAYVRSATWHGAEMLFGYTLAVIAGFLFTAVRNWTGRPTPSGAALAAIVVLWIAGRVLVVTPYALAAAIVNTAFPLAVAAGIGVPLAHSGNRRNYFFVALMVVLAGAELALHLTAMNVASWPERPVLRVVLDLVLFIMVLMGGRVIPMFTNNGVPGTQARRLPMLERAAIGGVLILVVADALQLDGLVMIALLTVLAIVHAWRLWLWQPWRTPGAPLVWILHASYGWIVVHFVLRALAFADVVPEPLAVHALTVGAIGGLTLGMMTRTARGHTGRPLRADRADVACYALVMLAALVRVMGPLVVPQAYVVTVLAASLCWAAAFALYFVAYAPFLLRPRVDGKAG